jgi:DNA-directed RNA polymerase specialized sigma24 family protein
MHTAALLERIVASEEANSRWLARRNAALCEAARRGVSAEELARRIGLSEGWVRQKIAKARKAPEPPAVEEAA